MANTDRMFRVIVLGGIALATTAPAAVAGCGGSTSSSSDGGSTTDAFPTEGPAPLADAFPQETAQQLDAFPTEGPAFIDAGGGDASVDAFPQEGPPPLPDSGIADANASDAPGLADGFPQETGHAVDP